MSEENKFMIEEYFKDLRARKASCDSIRSAGHKDESLTLICCYIDAIASQYYSDEDQSKRFSKALIDLSGEDFFKHILPQRALDEISKKPLFRSALENIKELLGPMVGEFHPIEEVKDQLLELCLNQKQRKWVACNLYRSSVARIAYKSIRCEAVHDNWAFDVSFGDVTYRGEESPKISYELLADAYVKIVDRISSRCLESIKFPWKINT